MPINLDQYVGVHAAAPSARAAPTIAQLANADTAARDLDFRRLRRAPGARPPAVTSATTRPAHGGCHRGRRQPGFGTDAAGAALDGNTVTQLEQAAFAEIPCVQATLTFNKFRGR